MRTRARALRTSKSHPIRVDVIPEAVLPKGVLGLSIAPGKKDLNGFTGAHDRDLDTDLDAVFATFRPTHVLSLMESFEYERFKIGGLFDGVERRGAVVIHYPIRDVSTPKDMRDFVRLIDSVWGMLQQGARVLVHCKGGLGRTGLVVAALLVRQGHPPSRAIQLTRETRKGAVETASQEKWVLRYACCQRGPAG